MSETVFCSARKELASTIPPPMLHSIFSKRNSLSIAAVNLFDNFSFFFHLIVNDTLRQQKTALEGLPAIIFVPKRSLLTQIRVGIFRTLYPPNDDP